VQDAKPDPGSQVNSARPNIYATFFTVGDRGMNAQSLKLVVDDLLDSLRPQVKNLLAAVLYGSRARGTATQSSDIDLLLIRKGRLEIEKTTRSVFAKYGRVLSPVVMTITDFRRQRDKALVQEIVKDHYVLLGAESFVRLIAVR
jgi:predicted nucleotidyltransferase